MDIQYYGANCVTISVKNARIVIDDNLADLGAKSVSKANDIVLFTGAHGPAAKDARIVVDGPGEYEVADVSITGIPAQAHLDATGENATMYKITIGEVSAVVIGHIYPQLSDRQLEKIGMVDIMFVPVGGSGYTLDPVGALKIVKAVEPKLVVPTHYGDSSLNYPVPQVELAAALHDLAMEPTETVAKLKVKPSELSDATRLIIVEKS